MHCHLLLISCHLPVFVIYDHIMRFHISMHDSHAVSANKNTTNNTTLFIENSLSKNRRIENSSCSACGHSSQDISHLILHCPATDSLRRSFFGDSLSLYDLWSRPWGVARLLGLIGLPPCPQPSEGVGYQQQQHTLYRAKKTALVTKRPFLRISSTLQKLFMLRL